MDLTIAQTDEHVVALSDGRPILASHHSESSFLQFCEGDLLTHCNRFHFTLKISKKANTCYEMKASRALFLFLFPFKSVASSRSLLHAHAARLIYSSKAARRMGKLRVLSSIPPDRSMLLSCYSVSLDSWTQPG